VQSKRAFIRVSGMRQLTAGFLVIVLAVAACTEATPTPRVSQAAGLPAGSTFVSAAVQDRPLVKGTQVRLEFLLEGLRVHAGCNTLYADADLEGDRLQVSGVRGTRMTCLRTLRKQEEWLAAFLAKAPRMQLSDDELTLTAGREQITLTAGKRQVVFKAVDAAAPDRTLRRTHWRLDTVSSGDTTMPLPSGVRAYVRFGPDGKVTGNSGCNAFSGYFWQREDLDFHIHGGAMRCDEARTQVEDLVRDVLNEELVFKIDGATLTLTVGDRWLRFIAGESPGPDRPLHGIHWQIDTLIDGTVSPIPRGVKAHIRFRSDGRVHGTSGCNGFGGRFTEREHRLTFGRINSTLVGCSDPRHSVEDVISHAIRGTVTYQIDGATLTVLDSTGAGFAATARS
jgi:heat shock protein HslJ